MRLFALALICASAHALEPPLEIPEDPRHVSLGAVVGGGYGSSAAGDSLLFDLGVQIVGMRSFHHRAWLAQWDGILAARGGLLGNTVPYTGLAGLDTSAWGELGYRWTRDRQLSAYTGAQVGGELSVLTRPGTAVGDLDALNNLDGVGGLTVRGRVRIDVGLSYLNWKRSLLVVGLFQEALQAPGVYGDGFSFTEGGVAARFDMWHRLTASLEVLAGRSPGTAQTGLNTSVQTTHVEFSALFRYLFRRVAWLALSGGIARDFDIRTYVGGRSYRTANAPAFGVNLLVGISLDRHGRVEGPCDYR
jgi:hypothetical protein